MPAQPAPLHRGHGEMDRHAEEPGGERVGVQVLVEPVRRRLVHLLTEPGHAHEQLRGEGEDERHRRGDPQAGGDVRHGAGQRDPVEPLVPSEAERARRVDRDRVDVVDAVHRLDQQRPERPERGEEDLALQRRAERQEQHRNQRRGRNRPQELDRDAERAGGEVAGAEHDSDRDGERGRDGQTERPPPDGLEEGRPEGLGVHEVPEFRERRARRREVGLGDQPALRQELPDQERGDDRADRDEDHCDAVELEHPPRSRGLGSPDGGHDVTASRHGGDVYRIRRGVFGVRTYGRIVEHVSHAPGSDFVQSLARGLSVIRAFDGTRPELGLSEVSRATGLTRATARRLLLTLVRLGYVRQDGSRFSLRPRVLELGYSYLSALSLPELAQPHMEALVAEVNESSSIAVGTRLPAYATSMGRVLLAALDADTLEDRLSRMEIRPLSPTTVTDLDALRSELEHVRTRGWAAVDQELELGVRSAAVPIRDASGTVSAAMNVSVHASRMTMQELRKQVLPSLLRAAEAIEVELGSVAAPGARRISLESESSNDRKDGT